MAGKDNSEEKFTLKDYDSDESTFEFIDDKEILDAKDFENESKKNTSKVKYLKLLLMQKMILRKLNKMATKVEIERQKLEEESCGKSVGRDSPVADCSLDSQPSEKCHPEYENDISTITQMGFASRDDILKCLVRFKGNVERTVFELLKIKE